MKTIKLLFTITILEIKLISLVLSLDNKPLTISFSFETKYIHEIPNDSNEDYYDDYGYDFIDQNFKAQDMINEWFFNGIYIPIDIGSKNKEIFLFLDAGNSDFRIGSCNKINTTSFPRLIKNYSYFFVNSSSFSLQEKRNSNDNGIYYIGIDNFTKYKTNISNEHFKFILEKEKVKESVCGNLGLNVIDKAGDFYETNFLKQLKNKELISNYIWTLVYKAEQFGNIIFGGEPHFYDDKNYFLSQYKTTYAKINKNSETDKISPWAFRFNNVYINKTQKTKKNESDTIINLNLEEAELIIQQGLIIGTEEYKNLIDNEFFNYLFQNKTCRSDIVSFHNNVTEKKSKYYVYSCEKETFQGKDIYYRPIYSKPYFNFPSINFFNKDLNYTFSLDKSNLFITKYRVYFLIIFEYEQNNKIWKLGEPFLSKYKFVFNPDQKTIGFYNPNLPQIDNDLYIENQIDNDNDEIYEKEKIIKKNYILYYIISGVIIIILSGIAIFLAKKLHNKTRKKRTNELDENFDKKNDDELEDDNLSDNYLEDNNLVYKKIKDSTIN